MTGRIGVTGSNGLVGRALRRRMAGETGLEPRFLARRSPQSGRDVFVPDLGGEDMRPWVEALTGMDTLIHLAAALPFTCDDEAVMRRVNVDGTRMLAEAALAAGVRRIVFVSTLGVHGITSGDTPFSPQSRIAPSGFYAATKYEAETVLEGLCAQGQAELVILRPPVVYGAGVGGKIGTLVDRVARGARLPFGKITTNRRQMIAADNLADAILLAARHPDAPGPPLLPADAEGVSTFEFLQELARLYDQPLRLLPLPEAMVRTLIPVPGIGTYAQRLIGNVELCDTRLWNHLNWHPPLTFEQALAVMVGKGPNR